MCLPLVPWGILDKSPFVKTPRKPRKDAQSWGESPFDNLLWKPRFLHRKGDSHERRVEGKG